MVRLLLRKLLRVAASLLGVTLIVFLLMHAIPGSPWDNYSSAQTLSFGATSDTAFQRQLSRRFGLDLPLWRQFTRYVFGDVDEDGSFFCGAVCGNLGPSIQRRGQSVLDVLFTPPEDKTLLETRFGYTLRIVLFGSLFAIGLGVPLGIWSATRPNSGLSRALSIGLAGLVSIPNFVLGLLVILALALWLKITTVVPDWTKPGNWIAPVMVLGIVPMASIARVTHASLVNILNEDYVRTARAKGLSRFRVMLVHVLRPALTPILTFLGPTAMELLAGSLIVESLYGFPGFGRAYFDAVTQLDYPMILGLTLIYAAGIILTNLGVEIVCELIDPRLRLAKPGGAAG